MPDPRPLIAGAYLLLVVAAPAAAQVPQPVVVATPSRLQFLPRYDFHLTVNKLRGEEDPAERFSWDAHFGGSFDLIDYVRGRMSVLVDYETVMGHEFRPFDPNQANYTLEGSLSARAGETELAGVFHHVSRHLSDRPKHNAIAWNAPGIRVLRRLATGELIIDGELHVARVVQHSYVDYRWITDFELQVRRRLTPRATVFARGIGKVFTVDGTVPGRGTQTGAMVEAGLSLTGGAAVLELFAGLERRVDAYPLDRVPKNWGLAGFRLLSR
jgi:hypothetical protein